MFDKIRSDKHKPERKKALSFTTKRGITFSMLTKSNIEKNQIKAENQMITNKSRDVTDSEADGNDEYYRNN